MESRLIFSRAPGLLRLLAQQPSVRLLPARAVSQYETSVNPQSSLDKPFAAEGGRFDPMAGPPGPVHPKIKQLQAFYQTNTGKPLWKKTPLAEFLYRLTWAGTLVGLVWSLYVFSIIINPKKKGN